jgi:hypothetical protein
MQQPDGTPDVELGLERFGQEDVIEKLFTYHKPTDEQTIQYKAIRERAKDLVREIDACCPAGPDRTAAVRHIREGVMTANASIATGNAQYR